MAQLVEATTSRAKERCTATLSEHVPCKLNAELNRSSTGCTTLLRWTARARYLGDQLRCFLRRADHRDIRLGADAAAASAVVDPRHTPDLLRLHGREDIGPRRAGPERYARGCRA